MIPLYEVAKRVKHIESKSGMVVSTGQGREKRGVTN